MTPSRRPRSRPPQCPACSSVDDLSIIHESGSRNPLARHAYKLQCETCKYTWWSKHRALHTLVREHLEARGQQRLLFLDKRLHVGVEGGALAPPHHADK